MDLVRWFALVSCALALSCRVGSPGLSASDIQAGLQLRGAANSSSGDHFVELVAHAGHVYVANSQEGVVSFRLEADGGLTLTDRALATDENQGRCTTLAIDHARAVLYCASDRRVVLRFDVSTPGVLAPLGPSLELNHWWVRDLEVFEDTLLISVFEGGLWRAQIGEGGALSQLTQVPTEGNARVVASLGEHVLSTFVDPEGLGSELRSFDPESWAELDRLQLAGAPLSLAADASGGSSVAAALGSGGAALIDVAEDGALTLQRTLQPPGVVTHALRSGPLAVAVTLAGAFAWDLEAQEPGAAEGEPRLFGFAPESTQGIYRNGNMLHALLIEGELITSDWTWIERWAIEREGEVVALDVPRGVYFPPEGPVRWRVRNPGPLPLRVDVWAGRELVTQRELAAYEAPTLELSSEERARVLPRKEPTVNLSLRVHDPAVASGGEPLSVATMTLLQREADDVVPPAVGDTFPALSLARPAGGSFTLPLDRPVQTIWYTIDCALMWPELEDLAWLARSGRDLGRGDPVLITNKDVTLSSFVEHWALEPLEFGHFGADAPPEVNAANAAYGGEDDIFRAFIVYDLPGDSITTDYVLDAAGRVRSVERMYRGPWSLAVPGPWDAP